MCMPNSILRGLLIVVAMSSAAFAQAVPDRYGFGTEIKRQDLAGFFAIPPDGRGLPQGSGIAAAGAKVFAENCAACHGDKLQGNPEKGIGGDRLLGGRGTLATKAPIKTVESYWPYSTTLFDYIKRAMPFNAPGSLTDDEVYGVVAYILSEANIIKPADTINAQTLPKVAMPNRDGFISDARPELQLYQ
jgi:mono/diheme cytochrome c family protein